MVANAKGIEIDTYSKASGDKETSKDLHIRQAQTPKHCNKGTSRKYFNLLSFKSDFIITYTVINSCPLNTWIGNIGIEAGTVPNFQPRPYPAYAQSQHAFRPPGLYNSNQRAQNGAMTYYGAPVMVSPGGYLRHGAAPYYSGGEADHAAYAQYQGHRYHQMYGTDMNGRSTFDRTHPSQPGGPAQTGMDFSRTVSSSFGENNSNDNKGQKDQGAPKYSNYYDKRNENEDEGSVASKADSDRSWKLLNQVASIEEEKFRSEEAERYGAKSPIDEHLDTDKNDDHPKFTNMPTPSKLGPLNSLSSVASAQEPLDTTNSKDELDLIQCASSGSLFFNTHDDTYTKRDREGREDHEDDVRGRDDDEIRRAASGSPPNVGNLSMKDEDYPEEGRRPMKKSRSSNEDFYDYPPNYSFSIESAASFSKDQQFGTLPSLPDKPRHSSYLGPLESKDKIEKDDMLDSSMLWDIKGQDSFTGGLSVESTITGHKDGPVITGSFSFEKEETNRGDPENKHDRFDETSKMDGRRSVHSHDYAKSVNPDIDLNNDPTKPHDMNKSAGTHSLNRTEKYPPPAATWVSASPSFNRDQALAASRRMHSGLYPNIPAVPSAVRSYTSSVASMQSQHIPPVQMKNAPNMLRNYSQDNSGRSSPASTAVNSAGSRFGPLHGPYGTALPPHVAHTDSHLPPSFRPPVPTLSGPTVNIRAPPPAVYIMSNPPGTRQTNNITRHVSTTVAPRNKQGTQTNGGVYTWTKKDDSRLSDIMKKFKNPKEWESIAKEFGHGKT